MAAKGRVEVADSSGYSTSNGCVSKSLSDLEEICGREEEEITAQGASHPIRYDGSGITQGVFTFHPIDEQRILQCYSSKWQSKLMEVRQQELELEWMVEKADKLCRRFWFQVWYRSCQRRQTLAQMEQQALCQWALSIYRGAWNQWTMMLKERQQEQKRFQMAEQYQSQDLLWRTFRAWKIYVHRQRHRKILTGIHKVDGVEFMIIRTSKTTSRVPFKGIHVPSMEAQTIPTHATSR